MTDATRPVDHLGDRINDAKDVVFRTCGNTASAPDARLNIDQWILSDRAIGPETLGLVLIGESLFALILGDLLLPYSKRNQHQEESSDDCPRKGIQHHVTPVGDPTHLAPRSRGLSSGRRSATFAHIQRLSVPERFPLMALRFISKTSMPHLWIR